MVGNDAVLLDQFARTGDAEAFAEIVRRYSRLVYGVCLRVMGNPHDSEDVAQECFLELSKNAGSIKSSLGGWLHAVARTRAINAVRSDAARREREKISQTPEPQWNDVSGSLDEIIAQLPESHRLPIILHYLNGYTQEETAQKLDLSQARISALLKEGVEELRSKLRSRHGLEVFSLGVLLGAYGAPQISAGLLSALGKMAIAGDVASHCAANVAGAHSAVTTSTAGAGGLFLKSAAVVAIVAAAVGVVAVTGKGRPLTGTVRQSGATGGGTVLGSTSFSPSPEHPYGWRGDGSGNFPGAVNPPTHWGRRVKDITGGLSGQSSKPKGEGGGGEPLIACELRDWLVAGPFPVKGVPWRENDSSHLNASVDEPAIANESAIEPVESGALEGRKWQNFRALPSKQAGSYDHIALDLALAYGYLDKIERQNKPGTIEPQVAYAHTYFHSPSGGKANVHVNCSGTHKIWLNGQPMPLQQGTYAPPPIVEIKKGWNRVLAKIGTCYRDWHFAMRFSPIPPLEYETKNVKWMTLMPGHGWSSPVIAGDKVFVGAADATLVCVNKTDGKILWARNNTFYHALTDEEKKPYSAEVAPLAEKLDTLTSEIAQDINGSRTPTGADPVKFDALTKKLQEKRDLESKINASLLKLDPKKFNYRGQHCGTGNRTPVTDGAYVYAAFMGGDKGSGGDTICCYDLNGKMIWTCYTGPIGAPEHGNHDSPVLLGDKLIMHSGDKRGSYLTALDRKSGKLIYSVLVSGNAGGTVAVKPGRQRDIVFTCTGDIFDARDGSKIGSTKESGIYSSAVILNDMLYQAVYHKFLALNLGDLAGGDVKPTFLVQRDEFLPKDMHGTYDLQVVSSALARDDLAYILTEGGALCVIDVKTGKSVYARVLDNLSPRLTWVFKVGCCGSPASAGRYIYLNDDQSNTVVIEAGREFKQVAVNQLRNLLVNTAIHSGQQEESQSNPVFEGNKMYYRSLNYLYCIGNM